MEELYIGYLTQRAGAGPGPAPYYYGIRKIQNRNTMDHRYMGSGRSLKKAMKIHGKENFRRVILKEFNDRDEACKWEARMVTQREVNDPNCYNRMPGGHKYAVGWNHTEETKRRIAATHTGMKHSEETRRKISRIVTGFKHSEETKAKIGNARRGVPRSPESVRKTAEAQRGVPKKPHTEETKRKISASLKGRPGRPHSEEARKKMSKARKGKKRGPYKMTGKYSKGARG